MPSMRKRPRPPRPTDAASVAVAITCSAADAQPRGISGSAHGTSTRQSTCEPRMPMPLAASRAAASTCSMPA